MRHTPLSSEVVHLETVVADVCRHNDLDPEGLDDRRMLRFFLSERGYSDRFLDEHLAAACEKAANRRQIGAILGGLGDALGTAIILGGGLLAYSLLTAPAARSAEAMDPLSPPLPAFVVSSEGALALLGLGVLVGFIFGALCVVVTLDFWFPREPKRPCTNPDCPEASVSVLTPNVWHGL